MAAWKLAPVLASGCCTVFKPSSVTPLSVLELARLIEDVIPAGVFNVITGSGSRSGQYILDHPGFRKLAFTGSTDVGKNVAKAAADRLIPATLELGGKSANIFFEDCDWEMANDSRYGLGGAVWTRDINRAIRVARNVETGRMWVNTYNSIPEGAPFGGYKESGIGRETHKGQLLSGGARGSGKSA